MISLPPAILPHRTKYKNKLIYSNESLTIRDQLRTLANTTKNKLNLSSTPPSVTKPIPPSHTKPIEPPTVKPVDTPIKKTHQPLVTNSILLPSTTLFKTLAVNPVEPLDEKKVSSNEMKEKRKKLFVGSPKNFIQYLGPIFLKLFCL